MDGVEFFEGIQMVSFVLRTAGKKGKGFESVSSRVTGIDQM